MKPVQFPQLIKRGSCVVTIYKTPAKGYASFTVVHYGADGRRCRRTFADYHRARQAAVETADNLSAGQPDTLALAGNELLVYRRAMQALEPLGTCLDTAALHYVELMQQGNGNSGSKVTSSAQRRVESVQPKLVVEVLKELLAAKKEKGRSQLYVADLRLRLTRFAAAMARPLGEVTAVDIDEFLRSLAVSPRSQNNFRATIGTLFRFGQARGYVSREHACVSNVEKSSLTTQEVAIFTPEEMAKLLSAAKPDLVPVLALGAFAGIRSEELKRLDWADIKLQQGHIEIKSANAKTKIRRLITIQQNLKAWLLPFAHQSGPVCRYSNLALQFGKLAKRSGVPWKKNALRHSYISHRVTQTSNVAAVSLEAGNSPSVITRNYLKCVTPAQASKWFSISPATASVEINGRHN